MEPRQDKKDMAQVKRVSVVVEIAADLVAWIDSKIKPGESFQEKAGEYLQAGVECARIHKKNAEEESRRKV